MKGKSARRIDRPHLRVRIDRPCSHVRIDREEDRMLRIGDVARRAGVSTRALRYYEEQGLLPAERTTSGQRIYPEAAVERVELIQRLYTAGLPSRTILALLPSVDTGVAAPGVFELLHAERDRITAGIAELERAREELSRVIEVCANPTPEECPALRDEAYAYAAGGARSAA